jgi:hypothetical protein
VTDRVAAPRSVDELWLRCQQRLFAYVAHDLKGALNGASVNIEVVRGRAAHPDGNVQPYAVAAAAQMESVIKTTVALLAIGRESRGPAEVSAIARQLVGLVEATVRSDGGRIDLVVEGGVAGLTSAAPSAVRLALSEVILTAAALKTEVEVRIRATESPTVVLRGGGAVEMPPEVAEALTEAEIRIQTDGHGTSIVFPGPTESRTEDA